MKKEPIPRWFLWTMYIGGLVGGALDVVRGPFRWLRTFLVLALLALLALGCSASNPGFTEPTDAIVEVDGAQQGVADLGLYGADAQQASMDLGRGEGGGSSFDPDMSDVSDLAPSPDLLPASCALPTACAPDAQQTSPDGCEIKVCGADCRWSGWMRKPGYQCCPGWTQSCNAGINCATQGKQQCGATYQWGACTCP